jgi:hypothetical protein
MVIGVILVHITRFNRSPHFWNQLDRHFVYQTLIRKLIALGRLEWLKRTIT